MDVRYRISLAVMVAAVLLECAAAAWNGDVRARGFDVPRSYSKFRSAGGQLSGFAREVEKDRLRAGDRLSHHQKRGKMDTQT